MPELPIPADLEAERNVLGALLLERDGIVQVAPFLKAAHFHRPAHGDVYAAILALYQRREPPDVGTVASELLRRGQLDAIGGQAALADFMRGCPSWTHVEYYGKAVWQTAVQRQIITTGGRIAGLGFEREQTVESLLQAVQAQAAALLDMLPAHGHGLADVLGRYLDSLQVQQASHTAPVIRTGLDLVDQEIYGWEPGTLNLVRALTSRGKTALALQFATHAAVVQGKAVVILSLEMDEAQIARRLLAREGHTDMQMLREATMAAHDWIRLTEAAARLTSGGSVTLIDEGVQTVEALQAEIQRAQATPGVGCDLLVVDYLQLLDGPRGANREQEVSAVSRGLKRLARQCRIPVIALQQSNDDDEKGDQPELRNGRESKGPGMDASVVMAIHHPNAKSKDPHARQLIELHILKNRDGERDSMVPLRWIGRYQEYRDDV